MYLKVKVHAAAKKNQLLRKGNEAYEIWVRAPAERGQANAAVLALLATALDVPVGRLWIVKGACAPSKIIKILGPK